MDLRIFTEPQQGASYGDLLRVARATEDGGFDAFFRSDHYLAMGEGSGLPGPTDAWITLAGLARETSRIRLGTLVSPVTFRAPGPLAIQIAQVDQMSGGRVELGLGTGWYAEEHTAYGIPFPDKRFGLLEEQLAIIRGLWTTPIGDKFSFEGEHYTLTDSPALPKPVQSPHPPIIIGGGGKRRTPLAAARYAAEFNLGFNTVDALRPGFERVRETCAEIGRDPATLVLSSVGPVCCGKTDDEVRRRAANLNRELAEVRSAGVAGSPAQIVDQLGRFAEVGVTRYYLQCLDLTDIDQIELIASDVLPQLTT
ncbi:MAG TPA: LLM class F420-dependent oxidoreductase [Actinopolymorphaceae bacterium]